VELKEILLTFKRGKFFSLSSSADSVDSKYVKCLVSRLWLLFVLYKHLYINVVQMLEIYYMLSWKKSLCAFILAQTCKLFENSLNSLIPRVSN
jgi:hypothetical protein